MSTNTAINVNGSIFYNNVALLESDAHDRVFFKPINFKNLMSSDHKFANNDINQQIDLHFINGYSRNNVLTKFNCAGILSSVNSSDDELEDEVMDIVIGAVEIEVIFGLYYESIIQIPKVHTNPIISLLDAPSALYMDLSTNSLRGRINFLDRKTVRIRFRDRTVLKVTIQPVVRSYY